MDATYNNQAYQLNTHDDFREPPPYTPRSPSPPPESTPPPAYYPPQYEEPPQQAPMLYAPPGEQQWRTVQVRASPPPVIAQQAPARVNYWAMIEFACLVFFFCNAMFGLIAFILAVVAENTKTSDAKGAQKLGKASMWLSIVGIIVTVVVVAIAVGVSLGMPRRDSLRQVIRSYISPSDCCRFNFYYYPGYGSSCYYSRESTTTLSVASLCCSTGEYYSYESSSSGYCFYYTYVN